MEFEVSNKYGCNSRRSGAWQEKIITMSIHMKACFRPGSSKGLHYTVHLYTILAAKSNNFSSCLSSDPTDPPP